MDKSITLIQVSDLLQEGEALYKVLEKLSATDWNTITPFKNWSVSQTIAHLNFFDKLGLLALKDESEFKRILSGDVNILIEVMSTMETGEGLLLSWWNYFTELCDVLEASDPQRRVLWQDSYMDINTMAADRKMEIRCHSKDIYDLF